MTMSTEALDEYLTANPEAARSALHDAEFAAEVARMRVVLERLDAGLEAEGLDVEARRRVGVRLVTDCLQTDEARARVAEAHRLARELSDGPIRL
ncbi:hypothetical protein [Streptomyces sp. OE57]|uniref:hypothetical protein n=1 Tax=Streptomyces lacaronensis TaxID=3379885 RepID=UPI0039B78563